MPRETSILIGAIDNTGADLTEAEARDARRALSGLAVYLDDAIDDEVAQALPSDPEALFGIGHHA
jgi:hypothetical protein